MDPEKFKEINTINAIGFKYLKIIGLAFILPMWITIFINEGAVLYKMFNWFQMGIDFRLNKKYFLFTFVLFVFPLIYLVWFYHKAVAQTLTQLHADYVVDWNKEWSEKIANYLIDMKHDQTDKMDVDKMVLVWINEKLALLPNWVQKVARKLFNKIPIVGLINSYTDQDLTDKKSGVIANGVEEQLNEMQLSLIDEIIPWWTKFIIPINIVLLVLYFKM